MKRLNSGILYTHIYTRAAVVTGGRAAVETTALNGASQRRLMVVLVDEMNRGGGGGKDVMKKRGWDGEARPTFEPCSSTSLIFLTLNRSRDIL